MDLRPAEIAMRQFSRAFFGADPEEVKAFLAEVAANLERVNSELTRTRLERTELQTQLQTAAKQAEAEAEELKRQLTAAQEKIAAHQKQESQMAQALMNAQKMTDDLVQSSKARADRMGAEAKASAQAITDAARREADELKGAAQAAMEAARKEAAELLRSTQAQAQEAVRAADRAAEARMAQIQREADRLAEGARKEAAALHQTAVEQVERFVVNMQAFLSTWEGLSRNLEDLARSHAGALEAMARTRADVESGVLPMLRDLLRGLSAKGGGALREAVAAASTPDLSPFAPPVSAPAPAKPAAASVPFKPGPAPPSPPAPVKPGAPAPPAPAPPRPAPAKPASPTHPARPSKPAEPVRPTPASSPEPVSAGAARGQAEIVVSPVGSYLQASRLVTAVSRIKGVKTARLRAYAKGMITIDVMTEEGTLAGISDDLRTGFPVDVVESTDTRLVLTLANGRVPAQNQPNANPPKESPN